MCMTSTVVWEIQTNINITQIRPIYNIQWCQGCGKITILMIEG